MPTFWKNLNKIHLIFQIIYKKHAPWTAKFQFLAKSLLQSKSYMSLAANSISLSVVPLFVFLIECPTVLGKSG